MKWKDIICWQMFMFWFLRNITFENRCECKREWKKLWVHTGCLEVMLQAVKATIQRESTGAQRRVRAHVVKSTQSVREKLNHTAIQAGGPPDWKWQSHDTGGWSAMPCLWETLNGSAVQAWLKRGSWVISAAMGANYWVQGGPHLLFLGKKKVSLHE